MQMISFLIGSCWLFISFVGDIKNDLDLLGTTGESEQGRLNVTQRFCNLVQVYSNIEELSNKLPFSFDYFDCSAVLAFRAIVWTNIKTEKNTRFKAHLEMYFEPSAVLKSVTE